MFVFQASGEEKVGVMISIKPNEFIPIPDKLEVITFNKNSEQGQQIISSEKALEPARAEVTNKINAMPPAEKEKANAALKEFDTAMRSYEIGLMNNVVARGGITLSQKTIEGRTTASINLSKALGYGGKKADPVDGKNPVGKLEDATLASIETKFGACASVTRMSNEKSGQESAKAAEQRKAGSTRNNYEILPKAKTGEASGQLQSVNYKVGGTLNHDELNAIVANSRKITPQAITDNKKPVASPL